MTMNGYVLCDRDMQLIVRGTKNRRLTMVDEGAKTAPAFFAHKSTAQNALSTMLNLPISPSASAYCKLFRVPYHKIKEVLRVTACTITVDIH